MSGRIRTSDYKFRYFFPYQLIYQFAKLQRRYYDKDLGTGYVVVAEKIG